MLPVGAEVGADHARPYLSPLLAQQAPPLDAELGRLVGRDLDDHALDQTCARRRVELVDHGAHWRYSGSAAVMMSEDGRRVGLDLPPTGWAEAAPARSTARSTAACRRGCRLRGRGGDTRGPPAACVLPEAAAAGGAVLRGCTAAQHLRPASPRRHSSGDHPDVAGRGRAGGAGRACRPASWMWRHAPGLPALTSSAVAARLGDHRCRPPAAGGRVPGTAAAPAAVGQRCTSGREVGWPAHGAAGSPRRRRRWRSIAAMMLAMRCRLSA